MRHIATITTSSFLLLFSLCFAFSQQPAASRPMAWQPAPAPAGLVNCVGVQKGRIPLWTASSPNDTLCNSGIYESEPYGAGNIGILNPNPIVALDVAGATNTSKYYQIGGKTILSVGSLSDGNVFLGQDAGTSNISGRGQTNTFVGIEAGNGNTTGFGNTLVGSDAGYQNSGGMQNVFLGSFAGQNNTTGSENIFIGVEAGTSNVDGGGNIYIGSIGSASASATNNIHLGIVGGLCSQTSSAICIGGQLQSATFIAGINGVNLGAGNPVYISSEGRLGTQASSLRFKEQVRDMGDSTTALMKLRPVTFFYKPEYENGQRIQQYGLIAEEVARIYPELVATDASGQPYSVRYQYITTMLLNEVQKQYRRAEAEAQMITSQQEKIEDLEQRLSRLESLVRAQDKTAALHGN